MLDANNSSAVYWTATATNAWGQITRESLGNGLTTARTFDAVTSWLSSIQSGTTSNSTSVQNASYEYDLVGNLSKRQNHKYSLTETLAYGSSTDNLYGLSSASVTGGPTLTMTYDGWHTAAESIDVMIAPESIPSPEAVESSTVGR